MGSAYPIFSVSEFTTWHQTFEEDVDLYTELGIEGIEICERKLSEDPGKALEQLQYVKEKGLKVTSVQPRCHALFNDSMCPQLHDPDERAKRFLATIDLFSKAFPDENLPLVTITGNVPDHNFRLGHKTARRIYAEHAKYAADHNMRIMFEPLSPVLMNIDTFVCTLNEGMQLIDDIGSEHFGLMLDIWHIWREPNITERIAQLDGSRIFGVHISDWPFNELRSIADRVLPGEGQMDLPTLFGAIDRTGYRGAYCLEIFSKDTFKDSLWKQDPADVIRRGRQGFQKAWENKL